GGPTGRSWPPPPLGGRGDGGGGCGRGGFGGEKKSPPPPPRGGVGAPAGATTASRCVHSGPWQCPHVFCATAGYAQPAMNIKASPWGSPQDFGRARVL